MANPNPVSNLPRDAVTGKPLPGPGRGKGNPNKIPYLAREKIEEVFEKLGGVEGMTAWANRSAKNLYAFYVYIYPRMLGQEPKLTVVNTRPQITRIETVIIDPKHDYNAALEAGVIGQDGELLRREPVVLIPDAEEDDDDRAELIPGEIPL